MGAFDLPRWAGSCSLHVFSWVSPLMACRGSGQEWAVSVEGKSPLIFDNVSVLCDS